MHYPAFAGVFEIAFRPMHPCAARFCSDSPGSSIEMLLQSIAVLHRECRTAANTRAASTIAIPFGSGTLVVVALVNTP